MLLRNALILTPSFTFSRADILVADESIELLADPNSISRRVSEEVIDLTSRIVLPGFDLTP